MENRSNPSRRILIISYCFAPQNTIGAVRPTKLAKYLTRMGHEVTVICGAGLTALRDPTLQRDLNELKDVRLLEEWNPLRRRSEAKESADQAASAPSSAAQKSGGNKLVHSLKDGIYRYIRWRADRNFLKKAQQEIRGMKQPFDLVFSSYGPLSVHEAAFYAKEHGIAKRWVADFRDELSFPFRWQVGYPRRYRKMLQYADQQCAVSRGFLEMLGYEKSGFVLSNGYDPEDLPVQGERNRAPGTLPLRLVYCGGLSEAGRPGVPDRDLRPVFTVLQKMISEGSLKKEEIQLVYAGRDIGLFHQYAKECDLADCVENHGFVNREEALSIESGADVLLMGSWQSKEQRGILTGKLFEYMLMKKPILCCVGGTGCEGGIASVLKETGLGECYEAGMAPEGKKQFALSTEKMILLLQKGKNPLNQQNEDAILSYAYPNLAKALINRCFPE